MNNKAAAWGHYWREAAESVSGCASGAAGITAACTEIWRELARTLPQGTRVLDLATGNGAVLRHLATARPGLVLVGVDSAPDLGVTANPSLKLLPGVAMETLPFEGGSFEAVTSQFGMEYGDTRTIIAEVARVLRPGGRLRFLIHHADSPVVAQGRARREQLRWALAPGSPLEQAEKLAAARRIAPLPLPPALRAAPGDAAQRFAGASAAAEIMTGMVQVLELGGTRAPELLRHLRGKVEGELARLDALIEAARSGDGIDVIRDQLEGGGLVAAAAKPVREGVTGPIFAWQVDGKRA